MIAPSEAVKISPAVARAALGVVGKARGPQYLGV